MTTSVLYDDDPNRRGLRTYLDRLSALRQPVDGTLAGLVRFLKQAAPLLRQVPPELAPSTLQPSLDPRRLEEIMGQLAEPLRLACGAGAFLNVWSVAGLARSELRNAAVLTWFLDPRGSHGFGSAFLHDFLGTAAVKGGWPAFAADLSRIAVRTEEWPLGSETDRVDVAIDGEDFVVFVEVKIDATEGPNQIQRYLSAAAAKARALRRPRSHVIFLGRRRPAGDHPGLAVLSWRDVARLLAARRHDGLGGTLAHQFALHIRTYA